MASTWVIGVVAVKRNVINNFFDRALMLRL